LGCVLYETVTAVSPSLARPGTWPTSTLTNSAPHCAPCAQDAPRGTRAAGQPGCDAAAKPPPSLRPRRPHHAAGRPPPPGRGQRRRHRARAPGGCSRGADLTRPAAAAPADVRDALAAAPRPGGVSRTLLVQMPCHPDTAGCCPASARPGEIRLSTARRVHEC